MLRMLLIIGAFVGLCACDLPQSYAKAPEPQKTESTSKPRVSVSGYARVGVSHRF